MFRKFELGGLLEENVTKYPEGVKFDVTDSGCFLVMYYNNPTREEIQDTHMGNMKMGFYRQNEVMLLLFKIGNMAWIDAPYSVYLSHNLTNLKDLSSTEGYGLTVIMVNARTGIIEAMRLIGMPHKFSQELKTEIEKQRLIPFQNFDSELAALYTRYLTKDLVKFANIYNHN